MPRTWAHSDDDARLLLGLRRVLEQCGWKVLRVAAPQWHRRREHVLAKIAALAEAG